jgi:hypothetical protein
MGILFIDHLLKPYLLMKNDLRASISLDGHIEAPEEATFSVTLSGVTYANADGTNRQDLLAKCRAGEVLELRRESDNPHDGGLLRSIGWTAHSLATCLPEIGASRPIWIGEARSRRTSPRSTAGQPFSTGSSGGEARTTVARSGIEKGDFDWHRVSPFMNMDRKASPLVREARSREKNAPNEALALYERACAQIAELDACGALAQAWRTTRHPITVRLSSSSMLVKMAVRLN